MTNKGYPTYTGSDIMITSRNKARRMCVFILVSLLSIVQSQPCLQPADRDLQLPEFSDRGRVPDSDKITHRHQAIVTSYQFVECCGVVTEWGADVEPDGSRWLYNINFQVWRPSPTVKEDGCYSLVGENRFTSVTLTGGLIRETPSPADRIAFFHGDVLGFYIESGPNDPERSGVVLDTSFTSDTVWYGSVDDVAVGTPCCPIRVGSQAIGSLHTSTNAGPVMSIRVSSTSCNSFPSPTPPPECTITQTTAEPTTEQTTAEPTTEQTTAEPTAEQTAAEPTAEQTAAEPTEEQTAAEPTEEQTAAEQTTEQTTAEPTAEQTAAEPTAEQTAAEPMTEQTAAEPTAEQTAAEPTAEQTTAEPMTEQTTAEPTAEQTTAEPTTEQTTAEPTAEQTTAEPTTEQTTAEPTTTKETNAEQRETTSELTQLSTTDENQTPNIQQPNNNNNNNNNNTSGLIIGITVSSVAAMVLLVLLVAVVCVAVVKKTSNKTAKLSAHNPNMAVKMKEGTLHIPTETNKAYVSIIHQNTDVSELYDYTYYSHIKDEQERDVITTSPNTAYATNTSMAHNVAYGTTTVPGSDEEQYDYVN